MKEIQMLDQLKYTKCITKNNSTISARKTTEDITHQINNSKVKIHISHEIKARHSMAIEDLNRTKADQGGSSTISAWVDTYPAIAQKLLLFYSKHNNDGS